MSMHSDNQTVTSYSSVVLTFVAAALSHDPMGKVRSYKQRVNRPVTKKQEQND